MNVQVSGPVFLQSEALELELARSRLGKTFLLARLPVSEVEKFTEPTGRQNQLWVPERPYPISWRQHFGGMVAVDLFGAIALLRTG